MVKNEITGSAGALKGTIGAGNGKELFYSKVKNPFGNKWVYLIDLKGYGKLKLKKGKFNFNKRSKEFTSF